MSIGGFHIDLRHHKQGIPTPFDLASKSKKSEHIITIFPSPQVDMMIEALILDLRFLSTIIFTLKTHLLEDFCLKIF